MSMMVGTITIKDCITTFSSLKDVYHTKQVCQAMLVPSSSCSQPHSSLSLDSAGQTITTRPSATALRACSRLVSEVLFTPRNVYHA